MKKKILVFHKSLAIYRVDFFNAVHENFNATFYFDDKRPAQDTFNQFSPNYIESKCAFKCNYLLKGFKLFGREFRLGINSIISKEKPNVIICNEYTPITIIVLIIYYRIKNINYTLSVMTVLRIRKIEKASGP